jgi:molybdenum cofactor guanylyltransferase
VRREGGKSAVRGGRVSVLGVRWGAVVLAGGRARRLGGLDKPALVVGGRSMLDTVLLACVGAGADTGTGASRDACAAGPSAVVVVGAPRATVVDVVWTREDPPYGGPVAGLAAGLEAVPDDVQVTAVLAADLPGLRAATVRRLLDAVRGGDGALLVDGDGRPQWLAGAWRTDALRERLAGLGEPAGRSLHALLGGLRATRVQAVGGEAADVDAPADLAVYSRHTGRAVT